MGQKMLMGKVNKFLKRVIKLLKKKKGGGVAWKELSHMEPLLHFTRVSPLGHPLGAAPSPN